ncbi:2'-5' RNA ligase family protein [Sphingomonas sp. BK235]|uniref:2'-5' RNA ligase family protein n=1 Tax=Sphingomonas sp. BK235 TaxID=2512131 RepID=UPI00104FDACC|nr:2'-5' RNA ligase family protein [Sphingomonas sp. BK235]TCP37378.1 2'-5' RNA ligase superfamily protein [Sphingomonas sp. BK235]
MSEIGAPIIVTALFGPADQAFFDAQRQEHFPAERNQLDAHLTMFHHLPPSSAAELRQRLLAETRGVRAPAARLAGVISLGRGVAYRVDSPDLSAIRVRLAEAFHGLLTPQDQAGWRAHVTIQNKVAPATAKALLDRLRAETVERPLSVVGLGAYWYRGGPWEPLMQHRFAA